MNFYATKIPEVIVVPGKMIPTSKLKVLLVVLALLLYVYLLLSIKTYYLKSSRLNHIEEMVLMTEKKILHIQKMDQELAQQMARVDKLYKGY